MFSLMVFIIKDANIEHFIRFSIEGVGFMPRKRRYCEKRYKIEPLANSTSKKPICNGL
jgi:hypothetical protein